MKTDAQKILNAIEFTKVYNENCDDIYIREAKCVELQLKNILCPIDENDLIAGRVEHDFVGFSSQYGGIYTYFLNEQSFLNAISKAKNDIDEETYWKAKSTLSFWKLENTQKKAANAFIAKYGYEMGMNYEYPAFYNAGNRVAGTNIDSNKLIDLGLNGLIADVEKYEDKNGKSSFYTALKMWLETLKDVCEMYAKQADEMALKVADDKKENFVTMAYNLRHIKENAPETFAQGIQLLWLYAICSDIMNYGRLDDSLSYVYKNDVEKNNLNFDTAVSYVLGLYKHFKEVNKIHDCRVILGGLGRRDEKLADVVAMIFMEASRLYKDTVPQLTLRCYSGMSPEVFRKGMEVNGEGCTFPLIYSDDTNIPNLQNLFDVSREEAEQYVPFGCGEFIIVGCSTGTPNNGVNILKALDLVLHNGKDSYSGFNYGVKTGTLDKFDSYEKLYDALMTQLATPIERLAVQKFLNYKIAGQEAPYLHLSLLTNDCLDRGKAILEGGVRYLNASSEIFGMISAADSLMAIKHLVYNKKIFSLEEVVKMLDADYVGYEKEREMFLNAPKYGNDLEAPDEIARNLFRDIAHMTIKAGEKAGLNKYSVVSVNNSMSAEWGFYCSASACGRKKGTALANANGASIGADKSGITALLNSMKKFDNSCHLGVINNIRFTKSLFKESIEKVEFLIKTFLETGGVQCNITVVGKEDLENAMKRPEDYKNLLVRIGGFSARFVELDPVVQREIISRTTYEG